jgi:hypothetical protein
MLVLHDYVPPQILRVALAGYDAAINGFPNIFIFNILSLSNSGQAPTWWVVWCGCGATSDEILYIMELQLFTHH